MLNSKDNNADRGGGGVRGKWVGTKGKTHIVSITMEIYEIYDLKFSSYKGMRVIIMWLLSCGYYH